jgi:hypothetical protein
MLSVPPVVIANNNNNNEKEIKVYVYGCRIERVLERIPLSVIEERVCV